MGYLFLAWKTFSILRKMYYEDMHIVFEKVKFLRATALVNEVTEFIVSIQPNSGYFEVYLKAILLWNNNTINSLGYWKRRCGYKRTNKDSK